LANDSLAALHRYHRCKWHKHSWLQEFTGVRALYLECNAISTVEGLAHMTNLRSLFMAKNMLHDLAGIAPLTSIQTLDIAHNSVRSLQPLANLLELRSLNAGYNKLAGADDIAALLCCTKLETLDLEANHLSGTSTFETILQLPLLLLKLQGNPMVSETRYFSAQWITSREPMPGHVDML
jgi:dynein assembly factor 1, axonemal